MYTSLAEKKIFVFILGRIRSSAVEQEFDFTDSTYQEQLPAHARSTAAMVSRAMIMSEVYANSY